MSLPATEEIVYSGPAAAASVHPARNRNADRIGFNAYPP
jgi:hypothetical protein